MHNGSGLLPVPSSPPMMKRTQVTGEGQELRQVNLSPKLKSATTSENTRARLAKAWEMTL